MRIVSLLFAGALLASLAPARFGVAGETASAPAPRADLVTRYYDVTAATPKLHGGGCDEVLAPYLFAQGEPELADGDAWTATDSIAEVVLGVFENEFQYEGRSLEVDERGRMRVVAPASVQKDIATVIGFLETTFRRAVELRIDVLERPAGAPLLPGLMSLAEAEKLVAGSPGARSASLSIATGSVATLDVARNLSLVSDYDVEIAQASVQHDPLVRSYPIGLRVAARAAARRGGVQLALTLKDGRLAGPIREADIELGGFITTEQGSRKLSSMATFQLISVLQRSMGLALFVPDGQAAVIETGTAVQTGASRVAFVLRASCAAKEPLYALALPGSKSRLDVLDASVLCPPRLEFEGGLLGRATLPRYLAFDPEWENPFVASLQGGDTSMIEEALGGDGDRRATIGIGPWIVVRPLPGDPAVEAPALTLNDPALVAPNAPEVVAVALTLRRAGTAIAQWSGPLLVGETSAFSIGGEQLAVTEAHVAVAQYASTLDPLTTSVYDGLLAKLRPARAQDGGWVVELSAHAHVLSGPLTEVEMGAPLTLRGQRGEFDELISNERLVLAAQKGPWRSMIGLSGGLQLELELR